MAERKRGALKCSGVPVKREKNIISWEIIGADSTVSYYFMRYANIHLIEKVRKLGFNIAPLVVYLRVCSKESPTFYKIFTKFVISKARRIEVFGWTSNA
jgi:hypothetical protein